MLDKLFHLREHQTDVRTEVLAGLTTFAAMSYVLVVNPGILQAGGMPIAGLITVTAISAAAGTFIMALLTNYPVALAPGMGLNAFFSYTVCLGLGVPWEAALGMTFWNGVLFLLLSLTGVRTKIAHAIPHNLKIGVQCGIGLFIAFLGLRNGGIIVGHPATFVTMGNLSSGPCLLVLFGIALTVILVIRKVPGAILLSVVAVTVIGFAVPSGEGFVTRLPEKIIGLPESMENTFFKFDLMYPITHIGESWTIILAMLFVNMFDTIGTLIGVSRRAGLVDESGHLPKMGQALTADAAATVVGSCLGTSTVTSYIESAAGVESGGRTGLTAVVVGICFLLALLFTPLLAIIPPVATAPALVMVGIFMMEAIRHVDFGDLREFAPTVVTLLVMPLAFSISEGIAVGFIVYVAVMAGTGRGKNISILTYVLAAVFLARYIFDLR